MTPRFFPANMVSNDGTLKFFQSSKAEIAGGASFVYNMHGKDAKIVNVQGYSLKSAMKKFGINHIDLLKMDCKGCEFYLKADELKNVVGIKIEYDAKFNSIKLEDLLKKLEKVGFHNKVYRINPVSNRISNKHLCHIYGKKIKS